MAEVRKVRSIYAPNPFRHPVMAWRMRRMFKRLLAHERRLDEMLTPEARERLRAEEDRFVFGDSNV